MYSSMFLAVSVYPVNKFLHNPFRWGFEARATTERVTQI